MGWSIACYSANPTRSFGRKIKFLKNSLRQASERGRDHRLRPFTDDVVLAVQRFCLARWQTARMAQRRRQPAGPRLQVQAGAFDG